MNTDGFETFERSRLPRYSPVRIKTPTVTIGANGLMHFSTPAFSLLGEPEYVVLLFTPDKRFIGFRKTDGQNPDGYRMQQSGRSNHPTGHKVPGKVFLRHLGIDTSVTRRYALEAEGDIARIDLEQPQPGDFGPT